MYIYLQIRGAPAIGIIGSLSVAVELRNRNLQATTDIALFVKQSFDYLVTARPTAVNITEATNRFKKRVEELVQRNTNASDMLEILYKELTEMLPDDISKNRKMGAYGAQHIMKKCGLGIEKLTVLTHCNTGSLASGGYGTALGVIRTLHERGKLEHAYCTETRPYNQGSRLTAYELVHDNIPSTLICDSMVAFLMKQKTVSAVVVGADRIVSNGDTANKIGTYQLAISAKHHGILFYIAAPLTTIDFSIKSGKEIVIEERKKEEMICFAGKKIAPESINCWNPAFDVTPAELITGGIITEYGVFPSSKLSSLKTQLDSQQ